MSDYLNELLNRMIAIEIEAMTSLGITRFDAKPYIYEQESCPYITHRIADVPISDDGSQDTDVNTVIAVARLVVGHTTQGIRHEPQTLLYRYMPALKTLFSKRQFLQSPLALPSGVVYRTRMDGLMSFRVTTNGGLRVLENTGTSANQIGTELQLTCVFYERIEQDYFADIPE